MCILYIKIEKCVQFHLLVSEAAAVASEAALFRVTDLLGLAAGVGVLAEPLFSA